MTTANPPTLDHDLPCSRCTYNLRGLHPSSICPECACPIQTTLDSLPRLDPTLFRSAADAATLMLAAILFSALSALVAFALLDFIPTIPGLEPYRVWDAYLCCDSAARVMTCASAFLLTRRQNGTPPERDRRSRLFLRFSAAVNLGAICLMGRFDPAMREISVLLAPLVVFLPIPATAVHYARLAQVARRLPRPLARTLPAESIGLAIAMTLCVFWFADPVAPLYRERLLLPLIGIGHTAPAVKAVEDILYRMIYPGKTWIIASHIIPPLMTLLPLTWAAVLLFRFARAARRCISETPPDQAPGHLS